MLSVDGKVRRLRCETSSRARLFPLFGTLQSRVPLRVRLATTQRHWAPCSMCSSTCAMRWAEGKLNWLTVQRKSYHQSQHQFGSPTLLTMTQFRIPTWQISFSFGSNAHCLRHSCKAGSMLRQTAYAPRSGKLFKMKQKSVGAFLKTVAFLKQSWPKLFRPDERRLTQLALAVWYSHIRPQKAGKRC